MPKRQKPSASGTEYVNAQLLDLKELIDKYADKIRKLGLPTRIRVIKRPYKINYVEGQTIKKRGMVIKAYFKSGKEWGIVPLDEVTLNPTKAKYSIIRSYDNCRITAARQSSVTVTYTLHVPSEETEFESFTALGGNVVYAVGGWSGEFWGGFICSTEPFRYSYDTGGVPNEHEARSYTLNNKTVYYAGRWVAQDYFQPITVNAPINYPDSGINNIRKALWTVCYGSVVSEGATITASWDRPVDDRTLKAKFKIHVSR